MGLREGIHHIGQQAIEVIGTRALLQGTSTLAGSVATMISCIHYFWKTTGTIKTFYIRVWLLKWIKKTKICRML